MKQVLAEPNARRDWKRKFWLVDVASFQHACVVVPDIGGRGGREFFVVKKRSDWVEEFKNWLEDDPNNDVIGDEEPDPGS